MANWIEQARSLGLTLLMAAAVGTARGDYALLQDGRGLFNVRVVDTDTTAAGPLQVRYKPESFGYNYFTDSPFLLRGHSSSYSIADYVTTTVQVGKAGARRLMAERNWQYYVPPRREPIPRFVTRPPTPVPTVTPVPPPPANVADASLPIEQRIQKQLDIFINEQTTLAEQLKLLTRMGTANPGATKQQRLDLLKNQIRILENYYPQADDLVARTREALLNQQEVVKEKGKFNFED